jgi:hypothetical protein
MPLTIEQKAALFDYVDQQARRDVIPYKWAV